MKEWEGLYTEITELQNKIKARDKKSINDYTEELSLLINTIKDHKTNLIQQLKGQGVDATDGNTLTELIEMIEEIEGGGGVPDYDFLANIEEITRREMKVGDYVFKTTTGVYMGGEFPMFRGLKILGSSAFEYSKFTGELPLPPNIESIGNYAFENSNFTGEFPLLPNIESIGVRAFSPSKFTGEFPLLPNIETISDLALENSNFTGKFPPLPNIKIIERGAFKGSELTGEFPTLPLIKEIGRDVFQRSKFTGEFPALPLIETIEGGAFKGSGFTGEFPSLPSIINIGDDSLSGRFAFYNSNFTGVFPLLPNIKIIGAYSFYKSNFTGEFPYMETLEKIGSSAFNKSNFDKDENGFVVNYPGWNGEDAWSKPAAYRAEMADKIPPKVMSIITPGVGEIEVLDDIQGERAKQYLKDNEPSDINYYLEYTEKLRSIGFERDQFGNYVDVVNDKSVIIIPEDIKFLV